MKDSIIVEMDKNRVIGKVNEKHLNDCQSEISIRLQTKGDQNVSFWSPFLTISLIFKK